MKSSRFLFVPAFLMAGASRECAMAYLADVSFWMCCHDFSFSRQISSISSVSSMISSL